MKKAVFIINSLQNGGAERVVATQANYLAKKGIDVTVIFLRNWMLYDLRPEVHTVYLSRQKEFSPISYLTKIIPLVKKLNHVLDGIFREGEVILMTSNLLFPDIITRLSRYSEKTIYVHHSHQQIVPYSRNRIYKWFIRWLYGKQKIVCVGKQVEEELREFYHLRQDTIKFIWNPIDFDLIKKKMEEPLEFPRPYILFCSRMIPEKHPDWMIRAFSDGGFYRKYQLVLLGVGKMAKNLKGLAKDLGVESSVCFAGWETNVYKWMKNASLFVHCADKESLGLVVLESLYCGCPVVAVRSPGPVQIMRGELQRYLCEPSVKALEEKMREAINGYPENLRQYMPDCSVEASTENYVETYRAWKE